MDQKNGSGDGLSRRAVLGGAAMVAGVGASFAMVTTAQAKVAQNLVKYQTEPKGEAKCGNCAQFQPPNACVAVEGEINPNGWCQLYVKKG